MNHIFFNFPNRLHPCFCISKQSVFRLVSFFFCMSYLRDNSFYFNLFNIFFFLFYLFYFPPSFYPYSLYCSVEVDLCVLGFRRTNTQVNFGAEIPKWLRIERWGKIKLGTSLPPHLPLTKVSFALALLLIRLP